MQQTRKYREKKKRKEARKRARKRRDAKKVTWSFDLGRLIEFDDDWNTLHVEGKGRILANLNHNLAVIIRDYLLMFAEYDGWDFGFPAPARELTEEESKTFEKKFRDEIKAVAEEFDKYHKDDKEESAKSAGIALGKLLDLLWL